MAGNKCRWSERRKRKPRHTGHPASRPPARSAAPAPLWHEPVLLAYLQCASDLLHDYKLHPSFIFSYPIFALKLEHTFPGMLLHIGTLAARSSLTL
jgi:hypothetical protein